MRRAGFGASAAEVDAVRALGMGGAVDGLLHPRVADAAFADFPDPTLLYDPKRRYATAQAWWVDRMLRTQHPLVEKMTLFWHGHFATSLSKVLTMTFSEFGRRVAQNASNGTDHGAAMPLFIVGGKVKGGLYGAHPSLADLDRNGDLKYVVDFRSVYATVVERWLGRDTTGILKGDFGTVAFV